MFFGDLADIRMAVRKFRKSVLEIHNLLRAGLAKE